MKKKESKTPVSDQDNPFDAPPDKGSHKTIIILVVVIFVLLPILFVGGIIFVVFAMLSGSTYEIDSFFAKIDERNYSGAHSVLIDNYKKSISLGAFEDVMSDFKGCSARVFSMNIENGDKTASGQLECDGGRYNLDFGFLKKNDEYRLYRLYIDDEDMLLQMVVESAR